MGELKKKRTKDTKEFELTEFELNLLKTMAVQRNAAYNQGQKIIQAFLSYIAGSRLGYQNNQVLEFELDPETGKLKITVQKEKE